MSVNVVVRGLAGEICRITVDPADSLDAVKSQIQAASGISKAQQKLVLRDQTLDDLSAVTLQEPFSKLLLTAPEPVHLTLVKRSFTEAVALHLILYDQDITVQRRFLWPRELWSSRDVMLAALRGGFPVEVLPDESDLWDDKDFVREAIDVQGHRAGFLPFCMSALLQKTSGRLLADSDLMLHALTLCTRWQGEEDSDEDRQAVASVLRFVAMELKTEHSFLIRAAALSPHVLEWAPPHMQQNHEIVLAAARTRKQLFYKSSCKDLCPCFCWWPLLVTCECCVGSPESSVVRRLPPELRRSPSFCWALLLLKCRMFLWYVLVGPILALSICFATLVLPAATLLLLLGGHPSCLDPMKTPLWLWGVALVPTVSSWLATLSTLMRTDWFERAVKGTVPMLWNFLEANSQCLLKFEQCMRDIRRDIMSGARSRDQRGLLMV